VGLAEQRRPERADASPEPDDEVAIGRAPADEGLPEVVVRIDEAGQDDHPAAVDHPHPGHRGSQFPDGRNMGADDEDLSVLELSEHPPVAEVRIHGEYEGGVPNQIAAASDGRGLLARVKISTPARHHDSDDQSQAYPDVYASHVHTPSAV